MITTHATGDHDLVVYAEGLFNASVCTSLSDEEATRRLNAERPAGTTRGWQVADEPFRGGAPNGRPCDQKPNTHRHLLFDC